MEITRCSETTRYRFALRHRCAHRARLLLCSREGSDRPNCRDDTEDRTHHLLGSWRVPGGAPLREIPDDAPFTVSVQYGKTAEMVALPHRG